MLFCGHWSTSEGNGDVIRDKLFILRVTDVFTGEEFTVITPVPMKFDFSQTVAL